MKHRSQFLVWACMVFVAVIFILAPWSPIEIPFETIAYGLMAVVGSYTGIDQLAAIVTTRKLPSNTKYTGNKDKLFRICIGISLLTIGTAILSILFPAVPYPLSIMLMSGFGVISFYVSGEKGKNAFEKTEGESCAEKKL